VACGIWHIERGFNRQLQYMGIEGGGLIQVQYTGIEYRSGHDLHLVQNLRIRGYEGMRVWERVSNTGANTLYTHTHTLTHTHTNTHLEYGCGETGCAEVLQAVL
jgi:hypothetical protein